MITCRFSGRLSRVVFLSDATVARGTEKCDTQSLPYVPSKSPYPKSGDWRWILFSFDFLLAFLIDEKVRFKSA